MGKSKACFVCTKPAKYLTDEHREPVCASHKALIDGTGVIRVWWDNPVAYELDRILLDFVKANEPYVSTMLNGLPQLRESLEAWYADKEQLKNLMSYIANPDKPTPKPNKDAATK